MLVLRVLLLAAGGAVMLWRAREAGRAAPALDGPGALLASRLALIFTLVGILALLTAATAALALRARPPRRTLRLGDPPARDRRAVGRDVEVRPGRGADQ
jgi:hypothetical protein